VKENRYVANISIEKANPSIRYTELITKNRAYKRSSIRSTENKNRVHFSISATDATALKATINSVLGELSVIESVLRAKIPQ
jgi:tRNA threonylcarbamoyladenosine modification (KEOPS) complex  Pcc1 subunit